ncbi:MAG: glycoside hydrolase family 2 TIM barrel-domain containing protein [Pirellulales bacterium]|jgi:hypothetical protein|nr:glycoside hydrolase family 2 TIM barrel-domain containing protein [Thermoguttaceae bacterium]MDD4788311.1 glycoside hydrolase family 2 TIM barrel-domain containing protein [Pirellulales bacterium]MDI9442854.1 glycoside hydrolase family 2 TIM barrel-domain containing protein [Planctomycetota bacterium]
MTKFRIPFLVSFVLALAAAALSAEPWRAAQGPLMTRWAKDVSPDNPLAEYPRPQMVREDWQNLNGLWQYAIRPADQDKVETFDGQILVPFAVESALSGVMKPVGPDNRLWYRRQFTVPADWQGQRILLHFGAVDWDATVWVNGREIGSHRGGYDPFTFDITKALKPGQLQEIVLSVWDPVDQGTQPRGKQVLEPRGIWYTSVTGIWQTVWIEPVPEASIGRLQIVPDIDRSVVELTVETSGAKSGDTIVAKAKQGEKTVADARGAVGAPLRLEIGGAKLWSPADPFLYDLEVVLQRGDAVIDQVASYFGMRKIALGKDAAGLVRLMLNDQFVFQYGPLDQGWWPDGLYTAPTDEALRYDLETLKRIGCNMLRKHVKVEPDRLYYWCDKLGLLVWQDMPNGDRGIRADQPDLKRSEESAAQFEAELKNVIDALRSHPSIVMWIPFNEGWGQYDTERIVAWIKGYDPTRLVNNASGWTDRGVGDVLDLHRYPGPARPAVEADRAIVLGEFGGLGLPLAGHTWQAEKNWGYRSFDDREALTAAYIGLMRRLHPLIGEGLSAAVYTQTTDVEIEVNGLLTYDRAVLKIDAETLAEAHRRLYLPPPIVKTLAPTSQHSGQMYRYTTEHPGEGWEQPDFDDSAWKRGPGGFGTDGTPGAVVRTEWKTGEIWLRRTVTLDSAELHEPALIVHHDEDAEVYMNGQRALSASGYTTGYETFSVAQDAAGALRRGANVIAIHCRQTQGGQYIDVGLVDTLPPQE